MSSTTFVTLPDGSRREIPAGSSALDLARSIGTRLADDAIVARVNGDLYDLARPLPDEAQVEILTTRNPESMEVYRHSTAHLLAAAVLELYPETKLGIGPAIKDGFYYDFQRPDPFTAEDLARIEAKMAEIRDRDLPLHAKSSRKKPLGQVPGQLANR